MEELIQEDKREREIRWESCGCEWLFARDDDGDIRHYDEGCPRCWYERKEEWLDASIEEIEKRMGEEK